jgi:hypothetical protein
VAKPISMVYSSGHYVLDFNINVPVSLNSSKSLTLYYDLSPAVYSHSTGINIAPILAYIKATDSKGTLMDGVASDYNNINASYNNIALPSGGVTFNNIYVFKSIPTFAAIPSDNTILSNGSDVNLYAFSIGADPSGDISVKQLMFTITITDPNNSHPYSNNFKFFKGTFNYTGSVAIGNTVNNNYVDLTNNSGVGVGTSTVVITFNKEETIPAGKIQTYTLKARAGNFITSSTLGSASISTCIPSDITMSDNGRYLRMAFTNVYGLARAAASTSVVNYNLLWSDKSSSAFPPHSDANGYSTDDWYNGFGVLGLPLPAQAVITAQ